MGNVINGTRGNDHLFGTVLDDTILGGKGDDTLHFSDGADLLDGGEGNDQFNVTSIQHGATTILGGAGDDSVVFYGTVAALIDGGTGNDHFQFGLNTGARGDQNTIIGGDGMDTYAFSSISPGAMVVDFKGGPGGDKIALPDLAHYSTVVLGKNLFEDGPLRLVQNGDHTVLQMLYGYNYVTLLTLLNVDKNTLTADNFTDGVSPDGNNVGRLITGGTAAAELKGGYFNDTISGGRGNETLSGEYGNDHVDGGEGNDVVQYGMGGGDDVLLGGAGNDTLSAYSGDFAYGRLFHATLDGGAGDDTFRVNAVESVAQITAIGGAGRDTYEFTTTARHTAYHVADFAAGAGGDRIDLGLMFSRLANYQGGNPFYQDGGFELVQVGANTELRLAAYGYATAQTLLILDNVDARTLTADNFVNAIDPHGAPVAGIVVRGTATGDALVEGGYFNDTVIGGAGKNTLHGLGGDDVVRAGQKTNLANGDTLDGGVGNDTLIGANGRDVLVDAEGDNSMDGGAGNDSLTARGNGNNTLLGGDGNDTLSAEAGRFTADGGAGDDLLTHTGGQGEMRGGAGADRFVMSAAAGATSIQLTIDGGAGNDVVSFDPSQNPYSRAQYEIVATGGSGSDTYSIGHGDQPYVRLRVTDFQAGANGDVLDIPNYGESLANGWVRFVQDGADTLVQFLNASGQYSTLITLANVVASRIDGHNFVARTYGSLGNDSLDGSGENDTLDGGYGDDRMTGGAGDDTYVVSDAGDMVVESAGRGTDTVRAGISYTLAANVENLTLTAGGLKGIGNGLNNMMQASAQGSELRGEAGNDTLAGGGGIDTLAGGAGNDVYLVVNAGTVVKEQGNQGTDKVITAIDGYTLADNVENLELTGAAQRGNGNALNNVLTHQTGQTELHGGAGNDTLIGGFGDDTLDGGTGNDRMIGNGGNDVFIVDSAGDVLVAPDPSLAGGSVQTTLSTYKLPTWINNLSYTGTGAFSATGNALGNVITGGKGADKLDGGAGNDLLEGGAGNDTLLGGAGDDLLFAGVGSALVDGGAGDDTLYLEGFAFADYKVTRPNATDIVLTCVNGDVITTRGIDHFVFDGVERPFPAVVYNVPSPDDDQLAGTADADLLDGRAGADTMAGGGGDDVYVVDNVGDAVQENSGEGIDLVRITAAGTYTLADHVDNVTVVTAAAVAVNGNGLNNVIIGNAAGNKLGGGAGTDTLDGGAGADTLTGGTGDDLYVVDNTNDKIVEASGEGIDLVESAAARFTLANEVENLVYTGKGDFTGTGNSLGNQIEGAGGRDVLNGQGGDDLLLGRAGNDQLVGGDGADTLVGDAGTDTLTGGSGRDAFVLDSAGMADTIKDLVSGTDHIEIVQAAIRIGNGDLVIDGAVTNGATGFGADAELVLFTQRVAVTTTAAAAKLIGSASAAYEAGDTALFALQTGSGTSLYLFTSAGNDAVVSAGELSLLATLTGVTSTAIGDYQLV